MAHKVRIMRSRKRKPGTMLKGIVGLLDIFYLKPLRKSRAQELQDARVQKLLQDRKIGEIMHGIKSNQLLLQDIKIEQEKLKLKELQRRVGDADDYAPAME